jgi:hypothetical protein
MIACQQEQPPPKAVLVRDTVEVVRTDTLKVVIRDTIEVVRRDTIVLRDSLFIRDTLIVNKVDTVKVTVRDTLYQSSAHSAADRYLASLDRWRAQHPEWQPYSDEYYKKHRDRLKMLRKQEVLSDYEKDNLKYLESWEKQQGNE